MGLKSWAMLWWPWLVPGGDKQSCYHRSLLKRALQRGGVLGAEHEPRHHSAFLVISLPPSSPSTLCFGLRSDCDELPAEAPRPSPWPCSSGLESHTSASGEAVTQWLGASLPLAPAHLRGCLPQGCFDQILAEIKTNTGVVGGVAAGIAALEVSA